MIYWLTNVLASQPPLHVLTLVTLLSPAAGALVLILLSASGVRPSERWVAVVSGVTVSAAAVSSVLLAGFTMLRPDNQFHEVLWTMYSVGTYHLDVSIYVDPLSAMLTALGGCTIPVLARYSGRYLHREPGYLRFFALVGVASTGFFWFVLGGSLEMAFFGWELLGLSSALLVAFFWDRPQPVIASGRVFATYRVADIALLMSMVLLHHYAHDTSWPAVLGIGEEGAVVRIHTVAATVLGLAFLIAAMGKSALFPLTGYVLRAMEGPTTSSALFYGTLSIHCGVYLILRVEPLLENVPVARVAVVVVGLLTAITTAMSARVRADAKGALALASAGQAGLMIAEAGMGWTDFAMCHLLAHGLLRLAQFLRSPSWLEDAQTRRRHLGGGSHRSGAYLEQSLPAPIRDALYAAALSRFGIDAFVDRMFTRPLAALAHLVSRPRPRARQQDGQRIADTPVPLHGARARGDR
ncbi:MAG: proton-conducting membrane transporter [Spirochaetaceae bacterium]|nr:proton-conducting membrane transporter [Myxococcales bacterium]MCB9726660.1 proton-conducting membrane transporter [Spirochaetaceae bacterium]HPG25218.1 proton-conducting transporter membrane subunit [Myxococcota bacterium]